MILFELRCENDHHFEGWFKDNASFDAQQAAHAIACPVCGDIHVAKAIMAPRLNKASGQDLDVHDIARQMRQLLSDIRDTVEKSCDYVGDKFPEEARKIHYGDAESRPIYGEATDDDARDLEEEGVALARIPWVPKGN